MGGARLPLLVTLSRGVRLRAALGLANPNPNPNPNPDPNQACSYDLRAKAYCDLRSYSADLPRGARHFDDPRLVRATARARVRVRGRGRATNPNPNPNPHPNPSPDQGGYSALLDFCPVYRPYSDGHCTWPGEASAAAASP